MKFGHNGYLTVARPSGDVGSPTARLHQSATDQLAGGKELTSKKRFIQYAVTYLCYCPYNQEVISSHLGCQGNTLEFGQKHYGRSQIYHRIFTQIPVLPQCPGSDDITSGPRGQQYRHFAACHMHLPAVPGKSPPSSTAVGRVLRKNTTKSNSLPAQLTTHIK